MTEDTPSQRKLLLEIEGLRARLGEAEETLRAIHSGETDAIVVSGPQGNRVFTLEGADQSYRVLIETMNEGAVTLLPGGAIAYSNRRFAETVRTPLEQIIGSSFVRFLLPPEALLFNSLLEESGSDGSKAEHTLIASDGTRVPAQLSVRPLGGEANVGFCVVVTDLTQEKEVERARNELLMRTGIADAARQSEERLRSVIETSYDWVWEVNARGVYTYASPRVRDLLGYEPEEIIGKTPFDFMPPDEATRISEEFAAGARDRQAFQDREDVKLHKDGRQVICETNGLAIFDAENNLTGFRGITRDITERRRAEEAKAFLASIVASSTDAIIGATTEGVIVNWNRGAQALFDYEAEEVVGKHASMLVAPEHRELPRQVSDKLARGERVAPFEGIGLKKDGTRVDVLLSASSVVDPKGQVVGYSVVIHDITERKRAEQSLRESEARLQTILDSIQAGILVIDPETHRIVDANRAAIQLIGVARDQIVSTECHKFVCPADKGKCPITDLGQTVDKSERVLLTAGNENRTIIKTVTSIVISGRQHLLESFVDISQRKRTEDALRQSEELFRQLAENIREVFFVVTLDPFRVSYISPAYEQIWGRSRQEVYERAEAWLEAIHPEDRGRAAGIHARAHEGAATDIEFRIVRPDDSIRWIRIRTFPVPDSQGKFYRFVGTGEDITERKVTEERIQFLAYYDALTGLPNRTLLHDRLERALASARRRREKLALLFLDLDGFKLINDSLGHSVGDLLLREIADRLRKWSRAQDTVARIGGDEFLIALTTVKDALDAAVTAERIMDALIPECVIEGRSFTVTCSIGISIYPDHGADGETLIKNADAAMYCAKESGRNTFRFFSDDMNKQAVERLTLEHSLRGALERNEFFLMYQPQLDIATGHIAGFEALLRWRHPELGLVPPGRFIQVAENSGRILAIGEWVLRTACGTARQWQRQGMPPVRIAVNVSALQFREEGFLKLIYKILRETGLSPEYLEVELTESLLLSNADATLRILKELRAMGVALAIDDFGTGYSSLNYLRKFRVSRLKIDRSFVQNVALNPDDAAIAAAIISMARSLNLKVVAEGVESEAQMTFLRDHYCDEIQGYYFSKPLMAEEAAEKLQTMSRALAVHHETGCDK